MTWSYASSPQDLKQLAQLVEGLLYHQVLTEKNNTLSKELEEYRTKLTVVMAKLEDLKNSKKALDGKHNSVQKYDSAPTMSFKYALFCFQRQDRQSSWRKGYRLLRQTRDMPKGKKQLVNIY